MAYWNADDEIIADKLNGMFPVGVIFPYAGSTTPSQFLLCDGSEVSRDTYADLFNIIGETYGAGDGSTTFNLPNLQGRVPVGKSSDTEFSDLGKNGGEKVHLLTTDEMPSHTHSVATANAISDSSWMTVDGNGGNRGTAQVYTAVRAAGGSQAHNNLQPYLTINYIIRY